MTDEYNDINIRHLKLVSGEEVISYVNENSENEIIILERPLQIHRMGIGGFFFSKWYPFSKKDEAIVNPKQIVSHSEVANDIKEKYIKICLEISKESQIKFVENKPKKVEETENVIKFPIKDPKGPTFH